MKTTMKIFAALTIMLGFSIGAFAQFGTNTIAGKAIVMQGITVGWVADLNFGGVAPGLDKTIDLKNVATGGQVGEGTQTTGVFTVSAAANSNVQLEFDLPGNLKNGGENLLIDTYTAGYYTANPFTDLGTTWTPTSTTQVSGGNFPTNALSGGTNGIYVFVGGTVRPTGSQVAGSYSETITLTATYN